MDCFSSSLGNQSSGTAFFFLVDRLVDRLVFPSATVVFLSATVVLLSAIGKIVYKVDR
jgi:hypothetical protein